MKRKWRWVAGGFAVCMLISYMCIRLFYVMQDSEWALERQAVMTAYQKSVLVTPLKVERFIGSKPYMIIHGEDKIGQSIIVWVNEDEVHTEMAVDGIAKEAVEQRLLEEQPAASIMRITPGKVDDQLVWEAFYKLDSERGYRYFYNYYAFGDGALIDTYRLSLQ